MGRARSQTKMAAAAVGSFNTVLGAHRGSVPAQAQRDASERAYTESSLKAFRAAVKAIVIGSGEIDVALETLDFIDGKRPVGGPPVISILVGAYNKTKTKESLAARLDAAFTQRGVAEFVAITVFGDPEGWPGLTAPAVEALGRYFARPPAWTPTSSALISQAEQTIRLCFSMRMSSRRPPTPAPGFALEHYQRLGPLCQGLGPLMARNLEERPQGHHWGPSSLAAVVVASAPVEALTGPLRSWVAVTAQALDNNSLDSVRRGLLTKRVENEAGSNGFESESEFMVAFAPIIKALWPE